MPLKRGLGERRAWHRFVLELTITLVGESMRGLRGITRDVSAGGFFFYVDSPFEDITNFEFSLALPASNVPTEKAAMIGRARVVRIEPGTKRVGVAAEVEKLIVGGEKLRPHGTSEVQ